MLMGTTAVALAQSRDDSLGVSSAIGAQLWQQFGSTPGAVTPSYGLRQASRLGGHPSAPEDSAAHRRLAAAAVEAAARANGWVLREPGPAPLTEPERARWFESARAYPVTVGFITLSFSGDSATVTTRSAVSLTASPGYTEWRYHLRRVDGRWRVSCTQVTSIAGG